MCNSKKSLFLGTSLLWLLASTGDFKVKFKIKQNYFYWHSCHCNSSAEAWRKEDAHEADFCVITKKNKEKSWSSSLWPLGVSVSVNLRSACQFSCRNICRFVCRCLLWCSCQGCVDVLQLTFNRDTPTVAMATEEGWGGPGDSSEVSRRDAADPASMKLSPYF